MDQTEIRTLIDQLNAPLTHDRLQAMQELQHLLERGILQVPAAGRDVNNHIHTHYSFSPYSPTKAVWMAVQAGLATAGIMDHDAIAGAREFTAAGRIMHLPTTIGAECRASFANTPLVGRRINNPDQDSVAYVALHGVPHSQIDALDHFFEPIRKARGIRNRRMTARLNTLLAPAGVQVGYDQDILPLSMTTEGGEVTERHLLHAVALKLIDRFGATPVLTDFLRHSLHLPLSAKMIDQLTDPDNLHLSYDLLGVLKSDLVEKFYLPAAEEECPSIKTVSAFAEAHGIILAYPYLGDITQSVTGDKKAQLFEDCYLDELFAVLKANGFRAVTYMPSRNSRDQLIRLRALCDAGGYFQISGEDINQPRQAFICKAMRDPLFANLYDAAWALIGHERLATESLQQGFLSQETLRTKPDLQQRINWYRDQALNLYDKVTR